MGGYFAPAPSPASFTGTDTNAVHKAGGDVITASAAGVTALTRRAAASQTAPIDVVELNDGTDVFAILANGTVQLYKGMRRAVRLMTANGNVTADDDVVLLQSAAAAGSWNAKLATIPPVLWYKLDENGNTTITDSGSGGHNGTLSGTYAQNQTALLTGSTASLQLTNAAIAVGDFYDFTGTSPFSVAYWFTPDIVSSTTRAIISKRSTGPLEGWESYYTSSGFIVRRMAGGSINAITSLTPPVVGTTYFVLYTYSGTQARLWVNPVSATPEVGPLTHGASINGNATSLTVGRLPDATGNAQGKLDEMLVWDSRVADADAPELYALGTGGGGAGPITATLPAAASVLGQEFYFQKVDAAATATIARAGSDTIDGATSYPLQSQYAGVRLLAAASDRYAVMSSH